MSQPIGADDLRHRLATVAGIFRERPPSCALRRRVDAVWTNEIQVPSVLEVVPDACIAPPEDPLAGRIVAAARHEAPPRHSLVRDLIREFCCSERTLRRRCEEAFGYGPKTLERILRFQRFLRRLPASRASLSALAIETGYADQAHLAREARKLAGQSPSGIRTLQY